MTFVINPDDNSWVGGRSSDRGVFSDNGARSSVVFLDMFMTKMA